MNKERLSFGDVEQLLSELAQHDLQAAAQEEAQTELMLGAARGEIRRVFRRRRYLRFSGSAALLTLLGLSFTLLQPEEGTPSGIVSAPENTHKTPAVIVRDDSASNVASFSTDFRKETSAHFPPDFRSSPSISYSSTNSAQGEVCDVVIYAVPL